MILRREKGGLSAPLLGCAQFTPRGYLSKDEIAGLSPEPVDCCGNVMGLSAFRKGGAVNHQDRQAKAARSNQFGLGATAAGILGDHKVDAVRAHQCFVRSCVKRASVENDMMIGQGGRCFWRVHKAQQVVVLGLVGKRGQMHATKGQKDASGRTGQRFHRSRDIGHVLPFVAQRRVPGRAGQGQEGRAGRLCSQQGIVADLRGEWMRGVDKMADGMRAQIAGKPFSPAKPAHAHRYRLRFGAVYTPRIAERRRQAKAGEFRDKARGLDRAAKDKDIVHG